MRKPEGRAGDTAVCGCVYWRVTLAHPPHMALVHPPLLALVHPPHMALVHSPHMALVHPPHKHTHTVWQCPCHAPGCCWN